MKKINTFCDYRLSINCEVLKNNIDICRMINNINVNFVKIREIINFDFA